MKNKRAEEKEEPIVKKAIDGDQEALEYLLNKYHNLAFYIALKICHCDADAEDIVQESFIEVTRSIHQLAEPKYFKAWLNRIIFTKATKLFRSNKFVNIPDDEIVNTLAAVERRRYLLPDKEMAFQSDAEILRTCIDNLPEKMRKMVYLMYFEQLSIKEIAFACELPEGTVKSRLNYAKKQLKMMVEKYEVENDYKITFSQRGMEAILFSMFAKEASTIMPFVALPKPFSFSVKGHIIEPSMMLMASIATCTTVGIGAIVYPIVKDNFFTPDQPAISNAVIDTQAASPFPSTTFQNKTIETEKAAYKAITSFAHCEIELSDYSEAEQAEALNLYEAMKQHGGAYYELLKNRSYIKENE